MNCERIEDILICMICQDTVTIPVEIQFSCTKNTSCNCHYVVCLTCARQYLQLHKPRKMRSENVKCMVCRKGVIDLRNANAQSYQINFPLMRILDEIKQEWKCVQTNPVTKEICNKVFQSQFELWRHRRGEGSDPCFASWFRCAKCHRKLQFASYHECLPLSSTSDSSHLIP